MLNGKGRVGDRGGNGDQLETDTDNKLDTEVEVETETKTGLELKFYTEATVKFQPLK